MKPKDSIKLDVVKLDKTETYPKKNVPPEDHLVGHGVQDGPDRASVHEELIHIPEDNQVSSDWVSKWR